MKRREKRGQTEVKIRQRQKRKRTDRATARKDTVVGMGQVLYSNMEKYLTYPTFQGITTTVN